MPITTRSEQPGDEEAIDLINYRAFEADNMQDGVAAAGEADLVRYLRAYCPQFDRRYSIVVWDGDQAVGHALFTPANIRLMGATVRALAVGPVAVVPERQRTGIGGELVRFGHDLGRQDGFALTFLCGHPTYYPRHGYRPCHGFAKITIDLEKLPQPTQQFRRLPVQSADIPWLAERCEAEWADVDFGWLWGDSRSEWSAPGVIALVWWTKDGQRAGYTLADPRRKWRMVLADDPDLARDVIATIRPETLDHHPSGWLAQNAIDATWGNAEVKHSDAAMACELQDGVLRPLVDALEAGTRLPGFCNWPLPFVLIG